jgi:dihydrofolate synthase/folylpolyglutamate synthase
MRRITNFAEARTELAKFVPPPGMLRKSYQLDDMLRLMEQLGNPQDKYKVVHVAGTSGKTSTSYFSAALLQAAGQKVGLTVSPHIDEVNERVQINLTPLPETLYCQELTEFLTILASKDICPTYFELLIAFAYWEFARQNVDYAVIEVGLGGLLDGTNVITRSDKVCIITDIGLDHMRVLGDDIASIATQKAGIILPHNVVFSFVQADDVMDVIRRTSIEKQAVLHEASNPSVDPQSEVPTFQQRNWALARATYDYIAERDTLPPVSEDTLQKTQATYVPARMEIVQYRDKTIVFDGSHNAQKIGVLCDAMRQRFGTSEVAVLFGLIEDKEDQLQEAVRAITSIAHAIITTPFFPGQDIPRTSLDPQQVVKACQELAFTEVTVAENAEQAVQTLLARPEPVLLVTGSFYLLNTVRPIIRSLVD